jgi:hypothetical protein
MTWFWVPHVRVRSRRNILVFLGQKSTLTRLRTKKSILLEKLSLFPGLISMIENVNSLDYLQPFSREHVASVFVGRWQQSFYERATQFNFLSLNHERPRHLTYPQHLDLYTEFRWQEIPSKLTGHNDPREIHTHHANLQCFMFHVSCFKRLMMACVFRPCDVEEANNKMFIPMSVRQSRHDMTWIHGVVIQ